MSLGSEHHLDENLGLAVELWTWKFGGRAKQFQCRQVLIVTDMASYQVILNHLKLLHFDFEMCFAPQRRALFRHLNFQKWSGAEVFCTFWLGNVLRATTACTFSTSQLVKVVRSWCALYILTSKCAFTWKCASRHNGVQFFISHLASWLRTRRFSEPTFRPSGATNHWKNTVFRNFPTFSRMCIFFLLTPSLLLFFLLIFLFSLPLPCSAFHLSILSEVWLLNFLRIGNHLIKIIRKTWIILGLVDSWGLRPVPISRLPTDKGQVGWRTPGLSKAVTYPSSGCWSKLKSKIGEQEKRPIACI